MRTFSEYIEQEVAPQTVGTSQTAQTAAKLFGSEPQPAAQVQTAQAQQNNQKQQQSVQQVLTASNNVNQGIQTLRRELQAAGLGNEFDGVIMSFSGELEKMMQRVQTVQQPQATPQQQLPTNPTSTAQPQM